MKAKIIKKTVKPVLRSLAELATHKVKNETSEETGVVHGAVVEDENAHDYEAAYQRRDEEATTDLNALMREDLEQANKPMRPRPPGGYRIDGKFVSAEVWNAWKDQQEAEARSEHNAGILDTIDPENAYLNEGDNEDDDSNEAATHSDGEAADMEAAETGVLMEGPFEIVGVTDDAERFNLLQELETLVSICNYSQNVQRRANAMNLPQLREFLATVRMNSGGSVAVAELLADTERQYDEITLSPAFIKKIQLVEAKGRDFIAIAQRYQNVFGGDTLINGIRYQEYHKLLTLLVRHSTALEEAITTIADNLGIMVPENLLLGGEEFPVVHGTQLNTKTAIFILNLIKNNLRVWGEEAATATQHKKAALEELSKARDIAIMRQRESNEKQQEINEARNKHERATKNVLGYAIINADEEYLCLKDENKKLTMHNLTFTSVFQEAILMGSAGNASELATRVGDFMEVDLNVRPIVALEPYDAA